MAGDYLVQMPDTVPLDPGDQRRHYGLGVAEFVDGGFGPVYGHADSMGAIEARLADLLMD